VAGSPSCSLDSVYRAMYTMGMEVKRNTLAKQAAKQEDAGQ